MTIVFKNWRADAKGTRRGYVELHLPEAGLVVRDVVVHVFDGASGPPKLWIAMPARRYTGADGRDKWFAFLVFARDANDALQDAANAQLRNLQGVIPEKVSA
jgi:DNA-binding cell septation regulator SpoVG